jgi:hypothetical protein
MHDIGRLVKVCTSMPGFCDRSRKLSGLARRAIAQAILRSGQPAPLAAQRYIDFPDTRAMSSGEHNRSTMLGTADHQTPNDFPFIQLASEPTQELQTTEYPSMPEQAAVRQRINPQWRANAEIGGHQATAAQYPFFRPPPNANDPTRSSRSSRLPHEPRSVSHSRSKIWRYECKACRLGRDILWQSK